MIDLGYGLPPMGTIGDLYGWRWTCPSCNHTYSVNPDHPQPELALRQLQRRHPNNDGKCTRRWIEAAIPQRRGKRDQARRRREESSSPRSTE